MYRFFSKIKNTFEESKKPSNKKKHQDSEEDDDFFNTTEGSKDSLSFKSAEKVYQFVSDLTEAVGKNYKSRLAQLFNDMQ